MGPTNVALVNLFRAEMALREAQARLDAAGKNVRIQDRRVKDLSERTAVAQNSLKEAQAHGSNLELDIKSRELQIQKLRDQQASAHNNKEYQSLLVEINTRKVDKAKVEEEALASMELVEKTTAEVKELTTSLDVETAKLNQLKADINDRLMALQAEVDSLRPARDAAAETIPPQALNMFEKLAERYEGEALAAVSKPDRRREEYLCDSCNMALVVDVYYKLHSQDNIIYCTNCRRILYIPADLPVETAVHKRKPSKAKNLGGPGIGAYVGRQSSAADVLNSVQGEEPSSTESVSSESSADPKSTPAPESI